MLQIAFNHSVTNKFDLKHCILYINIYILFIYYLMHISYVFLDWMQIYSETKLYLILFTLCTY